MDSNQDTTSRLWDSVDEKEPSPEVQRKSDKLLERGAVVELKDVSTYIVTGLTGEYIVVLKGATEYLCSCPATVVCSHVQACRILRESHDSE